MDSIIFMMMKMTMTMMKMTMMMRRLSTVSWSEPPHLADGQLSCHARRPVQRSSVVKKHKLKKQRRKETQTLKKQHEKETQTER